jgi:autotransporter strand-loop-strand O-heptosyltransferase
MNVISVTYYDGAKVQIDGDDLETSYTVEFLDSTTGECVYQTEIKSGSWSAANPKYYVPWHIRVQSHGETVHEETLDLKGKKVLVIMSSKSLGDSIAWVAMAEEFRKRHQCEVYVATFQNILFEEAYPDIHFVEHGQELAKYQAFYVVGAFDRNLNRNKNDWRFIPLQQIASDILGLESREVQPRVTLSELGRPMEKPYVAITEYSTWFCKQWLRKDGWQDLADRIRKAGFEVVSISKEPTKLDVIRKNGMEIQDTVRWIQHAKAFVGVSTGPCVIAWALGVPTVIVSGASGVRSEFEYATRVVNTKVCHGCLSDQRYHLDKGNWKFCPTNRNFECSREITVDMVWEALEPILLDGEIPRRIDANRVMFLTPHCSTGGGPQYLLRCVEETLKAGHDIQVVEYQDISPDYVVQKNKIKALAPFQTLNGNKRENLRDAIAEFKPGIIHLHEFPERFMGKDCADWLYRKDRNYKIIETPHSLGRPQKLWWPDAFVFVSRHHTELFDDVSIPRTIVEYTLEKRQRPPREEALTALGLDPSRRHILNVGLLCAHKNQGEIFEVARQLPEMDFHFVGNAAPNFASYWKPIMDNKPANCRWWGEQNDTEKFYAAMDMFVFASRDGAECNPLVLKEAIAWDMPVLMHQLGSCDYGGQPLVKYYTTVEDAVASIRARFPAPMGAKLESAYRSLAGSFR